MKKPYLLLLPLALLAGACSDDDNNKPDTPEHSDNQVVTFEDCVFADGHTNNLETTPDGTIASYEKFDAVFTGMDYYTQLGGAIVSDRRKISDNGSGLPIDCAVAIDGENSGANGSDKYCFFSWHKYTSGTKNVLPEFRFNDGQERTMVSMMVMNSTQMLQYMQYGFYSQAGLDEGEYVSIIATGYDAAGNATGTVEFVIGDRRAGAEKYITEWTKVDLAALGTVARVEFTIDTHGWSVPANNLAWSFCADDITFTLPAANE
jgi:hypothetical protein